MKYPSMNLETLKTLTSDEHERFQELTIQAFVTHMHDEMPEYLSSTTLLALIINLAMNYCGNDRLATARMLLEALTNLPDMEQRRAPRKPH